MGEWRAAEFSFLGWNTQSWVSNRVKPKQPPTWGRPGHLSHKPGSSLPARTCPTIYLSSCRGSHRAVYAFRLGSYAVPPLGISQPVFQGTKLLSCSPPRSAEKNRMSGDKDRGWLRKTQSGRVSSRTGCLSHGAPVGERPEGQKGEPGED